MRTGEDKVNCQTRHSQADADLLIDQTAVESARRVDTTCGE